ncbi:ScbA/BarX family gamma-butyrolactone biosynthesis protein [Kitasatospora herbaricolor]|uniref:A-factor biosynthesis hotdog domain-containing protein n=1 Tax=Kitasatospora herbaricolor TaxID=68217 RepID=A0ABZ1WBL7_9ACTN|nr:ScbA/BarX family gamma-butyrolactone biosynthesis protein [Kitasatospora herbaricolor]
MPLIAELGEDEAYPEPSAGYDFHERTVSRHLVHRTTVSEVFLTGWQATGPYDFLLGAQWPRAHGFYRLPGDVQHDPVLLAETIRQAGLLISHVGFGVPQGHQFAMDDLSYAVDLDGLAIDARPASLMLRVSCQDVRMRHRRLASLRVEVQAERDGRPLGHGSGQVSVIPPQAYRRLRGRDGLNPAPLRPGTPTTPALVGRENPSDVVLTPARQPGTWLLRADARHPVLFDHPVDHVPGMLVLEAARQAAQRLRHPEPVVPVEAISSFEHYIELDRPCLVRAWLEPAPDPRRVPVRVTLEQDGRTAAECRLVTEPLTPAAALLDAPALLDGPGFRDARGQGLQIAS